MSGTPRITVVSPERVALQEIAEQVGLMKADLFCLILGLVCIEAEVRDALERTA
jgi:hypothetical protein